MTNLPSTTVATPPRSWWRIIARGIERILAIAGLIALFFNFVIFPVRIISGSMSPTLQGETWKDGDTVWIDAVTYCFRRPRRWEVMAFRNETGTIVAKRVVGLPGERVQMEPRGKLVINGQPCPRPEALQHIKFVGAGKIVQGATYTCEDGYFVLGDHALDSDDSRFNGEIKPNQILGRAWFISSPRKHMGWVK